MLHGVTGIVVAHRASTVLLADKVALLENGTITHVGTHAELLARVPQYRYLLAADDELDDDAERSCAWEDDEERSGCARYIRSARPPTPPARPTVRAPSPRLRPTADDRNRHAADRGPRRPDDWRGAVASRTARRRPPIDETVPRRREARALLGYAAAAVPACGRVARHCRGGGKRCAPFGSADWCSAASTTASRRSLDGGSARELHGHRRRRCAAVVLVQATQPDVLPAAGPARIGQKVLLELRRRVFRHFQRLDVAFHDRYTSGRVVSRSTNDVEAIQDMLETGFDSLITAALTLVGTAILLVTLDVRLGLMCLAAFPLLVVLVWWFRDESAKTYRKVRESAALVIVQFVETMTGIKAVQAYRREPRNQEIFEDVADRYRDDNEKTFRLLAIFMPGVKLVGNLTTGVVLLYGGYRVLHGADDDRHAGGVPAVPADVLRADAGDLASSSTRSSRRRRPWRSWPVCLPSGPASRIRRSRSRWKPCAARSSFHDVQFSYVPDRLVLPGPRPARSRRGRPSRWSAPPAPARRPSPS